MIDNQSPPLDNNNKVNKPWQFQPGQSGNPAGRPRGRTLTEVMRHMLDAKEGMREALITRLFTIILKGKDPDSLTALKFLTERLEGRPALKLESDETKPTLIFDVHEYLKHSKTLTGDTRENHAEYEQFKQEHPDSIAVTIKDYDSTVINSEDLD